MFKIFFESSLIGFITFVIGTILFNLSINRNNIGKNDKLHGINIAFFMTGVMIHVILELTL